MKQSELRLGNIEEAAIVEQTYQTVVDRFFTPHDDSEPTPPARILQRRKMVKGPEMYELLEQLLGGGSVPTVKSGFERIKRYIDKGQTPKYFVLYGGGDAIWAGSNKFSKNIFDNLPAAVRYAKAFVGAAAEAVPEDWDGKEMKILTPFGENWTLEILIV